MTEQEKIILLLQDICERIPYEVKCTTKSKDWQGVYLIYGCVDKKILINCLEEDKVIVEPVQNIVPYLRPMSSMTEKEAEDYFKNSEYESSECYEASANYESVTVKAACSADEACVNTNWLIAHHFDYRGLIPMGLALPATEGMYK